MNYEGRRAGSPIQTRMKLLRVRSRLPKKPAVTKVVPDQRMKPRGSLQRGAIEGCSWEVYLRGLLGV